MVTLPAKIGKYRILSQIAQGGMGAVFKAEHPTLNRIVIIKRLTLSTNRDFIERFKREANIMMDFRHEHIVQVYDHFKEDNAYHIVMEFVDGITLEQLIADRRFIPNQAAILIFNQICHALKYAHDQNVLHRDIKPANILISREGVVKLVDFGVSATLDAGDEDTLTRAGMTIGTPSYLAPEQIANARNRDKRADIYAAGVLLYEMVVGRRPFQGGFTPEIIVQIEKGKYTPPGKINPKIWIGIRRIIRQAMHHRVKKRYQDFGTVITKLSPYLKRYREQETINRAIQHFLEGQDDLEKKPRNRIPAFISRRWLFSGLLVILLGVGLTWGLLKYRETGIVSEILAADEYGALRLILELPKTHKPIAAHFINATLYREESGKLTQEKDIRFAFKTDAIPDAAGTITWTSQTVYLRKNTYLVVLYAENEQYRENFYLFPRRVQKTSLTDKDGQTIHFSPGSPPSLPVTLRLEVCDYFTDRPLPQPERFLAIEQQGQWIGWPQFSADAKGPLALVSNRRYRLRINPEGYFSKETIVTIQPEQTQVTMKIRMIPLPGEIRLRTDTDRKMIPLINNSLLYLAGGENPQWQQTMPLTSTYQTIRLPPGEFFLTVKLDRFPLNWLDGTSETRKISLAPGQKMTVDVLLDRDGKTLTIVIP